MRLKHFLSVFLTLLTLSVGQMWGVTISFTGSTLPSGWSGNGSYDTGTASHYHSASPGYILASGKNLTSCEYTNITALTFWGSTSSGGNNKAISIQYKESGSSTWNNLASVTLNSGSQVQKTVTVTSLSGKTVALKFSSSFNTAYLDDIEITTGSSSPVDPTASFSNGTYTIEGNNLDLASLWTSNSTGSVTYSVTNANGTGATCTSAGSFSATTAGTCTVQATQDATTGYNSITKTATITVREPVVCTYSEANSLSVGDEIYIVYESGNTKKQMNTATGTEDITDCADYKFTVVKGYNNENLALKNSDNKYLTWSSSTSCAMTATSLTSTSGSWTTITSNGHLVLKNVSSNRYLMYKTSDASVRAYAALDQSGATLFTIYKEPSCTSLGQINGSFFWTTHFCPVWPAKHRLNGYYTNLGITSG